MIAFAVRRIFLARAVVDQRKSFDTLAALVRDQLGGDVLGGDAFVFVGRDRRRLKILLFARGGFWLCARRLERGTFALPSPALPRDARETLELDHAQWALLLDGIHASVERRSPRWNPAG